MHTLVVYETIYGDTHAVAEGIAGGLRAHGEVRVVAVGHATAELVDWADLVIVGGPTHAHGMTRASTRKGAREAAAKPASELTLDPDAEGPGSANGWDRSASGVAEASAPRSTAGRRASAVDRPGLGRHRQPAASSGFRLVAEPAVPGGPAYAARPRRIHRAARWGADLAAVLVPTG